MQYFRLTAAKDDALNHLSQTHRLVCLVFITIVLFCWYATQADARQSLFEAFKPVIVIDPGHGGQDGGARGPDGTLEKAVTLELARLVATKLEPEFKVVLTRTDDYQVDLVQRTAAANHLKADVFVAIHTGGSFVHSTTGSAIYHYKNSSGVDPTRKKAPSSTRKGAHTPVLWKNVQISHISRSRALAGMIDHRLKGLPALQSRIEGAQLAVLQGAAMPAVLIEVGYLTNPAEEKKLRDQGFLLDLAEQISLGIEDFLEQNKK
jgi:N-acetylmuramoyl-L-alanine amidase